MTRPRFAPPRTRVLPGARLQLRDSGHEIDPGPGPPFRPSFPAGAPLRPGDPGREPDLGPGPSFRARVLPAAPLQPGDPGGEIGPSFERARARQRGRVITPGRRGDAPAASTATPSPEAVRRGNEPRDRVRASRYAAPPRPAERTKPTPARGPVGRTRRGRTPAGRANGNDRATARRWPSPEGEKQNGESPEVALSAVFWASWEKSRRRPTLPHGYPCSTIGSEELNFRVRDGIGCGLFEITTGNCGIRRDRAMRRCERGGPESVLERC